MQKNPKIHIGKVINSPNEVLSLCLLAQKTKIIAVRLASSVGVSPAL
jgi:hypothetical protein